MATAYSYKESDLLKTIQAAWNIDHDEAEIVLRKFVRVFGMEGAEKHLSLNGPACAVCGISPDDYLELCAPINRIINADNQETIFVLGIRNLIMATREP
jgi:hypothetical protein